MAVSAKARRTTSGPPSGDAAIQVGEVALLSALGTPIETQSLIFDPDWYKREYPDVQAASLDPVMHFFDNGVREGRNPNRHFDTKWYAVNNPDVAAAGLNPFLHYLLYGAREGRRPKPD